MSISGHAQRVSARLAFLTLHTAMPTTVHVSAAPAQDSGTTILGLPANFFATSATHSAGASSTILTHWVAPSPHPNPAATAPTTLSAIPTVVIIGTTTAPVDSPQWLPLGSSRHMGD